MSEMLTVDFTQPIPLFPLPTCALLPHAAVPLHIFEQRYRTLTRDALDSAGLIAMAVFAGDNWKQVYDNAPPLRDYVCVGKIVRHERLGDGRYNILLHGICRARILHEVDADDYRLAMLDPVDTETVMEIDLQDQRHRLEALLADVGLSQLVAVSTVRTWLSDELPTVALVDLAALAICQNAEDRYAMLAEPDALVRADWLLKHLQQTSDLLALADRMGPATDDDGLPLN